MRASWLAAGCALTLLASGCSRAWHSLELQFEDASAAPDAERDAALDAQDAGPGIRDATVDDAIRTDAHGFDVVALPDATPDVQPDSISVDTPDSGTDVPDDGPDDIVVIDVPVSPDDTVDVVVDDVPVPPMDTGMVSDVVTPDDAGGDTDTGIPGPDAGDDTGGFLDDIAQDPCVDQGLTNCNGVCIDTQSDSFNCGGCDYICPLSYQCNSGRCLPF